jgi:hypothetical protein
LPSQQLFAPFFVVGPQQALTSSQQAAPVRQHSCTAAQQLASLPQHLLPLAQQPSFASAAQHAASFVQQVIFFWQQSETF